MSLNRSLPPAGIWKGPVWGFPFLTDSSGSITGLIGVLSRPGIGTRFSIYLPLDSRTPIMIRPAILCCDTDASFLNEIKMSFVDVLDWQGSPEDTCEDIIAYLEAHPEIDIFIFWKSIFLPWMVGH